MAEGLKYRTKLVEEMQQLVPLSSSAIAADLGWSIPSVYGFLGHRRLNEGLNAYGT